MTAFTEGEAMAVEPEITQLLRQINVAREALAEIADIAVPDGGDHRQGLKEAQDLAAEAMRECGWLPQ
jgi:hypothetical protein